MMLGTEKNSRHGDTDLKYELRRSDRKTLSITVHPDGAVTVSAPRSTGLETIKARVEKRLGWITEKQREFEALRPRTPARRYLSGETHRHLGRQYRLKLDPDCADGVELGRDRLVIGGRHAVSRGAATRALARWRRARAKVVFQERLEAVLKRYRQEGLQQPTLSIRKLDKRWGGLSRDGSRLVLNIRLIEAGVDEIDYVLIHELAHAIHPDHGVGFLDLLQRKLPDWRERKRRLERGLL